METQQESDARLDASDPAKLLPFTGTIEPHDPDAELLPKQYIGSDRSLYGDVVQ